MAGRSRPVKALLLDQRAMAGLGNIYSDEVLHAARLRFDRPAGSLRPRQVTDLHRAIVEILGAAIEAGGSTLADAQYVGLSGQPGRYQHQHRVYGREGAPCPRCGPRSSVTRARFAGRSTFYCPPAPRRGPVLVSADVCAWRMTSRNQRALSLAVRTMVS